MEGIKRLAEMLEGQKDKYLIIIVNHLMLQTEMNEAFLNEEKNLKDMATYKNPKQYPVGIDTVIVNGVVAFEDGRQLEVLPGRFLKNSFASK